MLLQCATIDRLESKLIEVAIFLSAGITVIDRTVYIGPIAVQNLIKNCNFFLCLE